MSAAETAEHARLVDQAIQDVVQLRHDEADAAAAAALALDPRSARALAVRGLVRLQRARASDPPDLFGSNAGESDVRVAAQLAPNDAWVGWTHAVFLAESGHMSAAAGTAEAAIERCTDAPANERAALLGIAGTYRYELGEERAAVPHLEAYVTLRPDDATAQFRLGSCRLRIAAVPKGKKPQSLRSARLVAESAVGPFQRCFELAPGDEDAGLAVATAWSRAAELSDELGDDAAAQRQRSAASGQLLMLMDRFPASAEVRCRLGRFAAAADDAAAARTHYEAALQRDPDHAGALAGLAHWHAAAGEPAAARALLLRLLAVEAERPSLGADELRRIREWLQQNPE